MGAGVEGEPIASCSEADCQSIRAKLDALAKKGYLGKAPQFTFEDLRI